MNKEDQRNYELTFILSPELDEGGVVSFEQEVEKSIKNLGGDFKKKSKVERRSLSYPIKKFQTGYYSVISFLFNPEKLEELSAVFKHKKEILRYIFTIAEEPAVVKKPLNRQRHPMETEPRLAQAKDKKRIEKIKELTEEVTEKEIEALKKAGRKEFFPIQKPQEDKKEKKRVKLEEIDKKLKEILGI